MAAAFAHFDEPHAWLIRGLVEYGWADQSQTRVAPPQGSVGSLDLTGFADSVGASGVMLELPAWADGEWCDEDGSYRFEVKLQTLSTGSTGFIVRCPAANFFQEFGYDRANPTWAAGFIHQSLTQYVPEFVRWRLGGGHLDWSTRAGIPDVDGETCSPQLAAFVGQTLRRSQRFDQGPAEGWWLQDPANAGPIATAGAGLASPRAAPGMPAIDPGSATTATPVAASQWSGPIATAGAGGGDPVYLSAAARARQSSKKTAVGGGGDQQALARTASPGMALMVTSGLGLLQAGLWFANGVSVVAKYHDAVLALIVSIFLSVVLFLGGVAAAFGAWQYRRAQGHIMPYVAMVYAAVTPGCCLGGLPVAIWAFRRWRDPMVSRGRDA
ncbi:MAG: hypothetical protein VX265_07150 [Myxococcota bacterium]|nr:hypothetical protein [Myxococcota bacterium]